MSERFNKILIINPGGIGDLVMFSPVLQILKNNFPNSLIDVFLSPSTTRTGIFQGSKIVRKVFYSNKINDIWRLRKEKYDLVFIASGVSPLKGILLAIMIGGKKIASDYGKFKLNGNLHKIKANLNILESLGIKTEKVPLMIFETSEDDKKFAEDFILKNELNDKILIGFSLGSGTTQQFKLWPNENFFELGKKILSNYPDAFIFLFGSLGEKDICSKIQNELNGKAMAIISKPLGQVAALTDKCKIFVSSDTGLCHIAVTTNTELIVIFGPTIPERTGPVGKRVHIISEKCRYRYHDIFTKNYDTSKKHECLKKITPEIVFNKIKEILQHEQ